MSKQCGNCSMCCKVLRINEFAKPANAWCQHIAKGGGCSIYESRYATCRGYQCAWLGDEALGPEWQPNRSKFIMHRVDGKLGLWVNVDLAFPLAWRDQPYYAQLKEWSSAAERGEGYVAVVVGQRTFVLFPQQDLEIPDLPHNADLKVGYRHLGSTRRPIVMVRDAAGSVSEYLGDPIN